MTWETENSHQRTNPPNGLCSSMSLFCFKSHAIVNSGGVVSGMSGSVFQKNKRRRINWRIKAAEKHWLKQVISQKFEDLFQKVSTQENSMSVSDTVSSVTFGPLKGLGTHCHLLKVTQVICQKCACLQKCCVNSSATRLTPGCSRVIRQEYSELSPSPPSGTGRVETCIGPCGVRRM